ncbi:MAG: hypothetical protein ACR2NN_22680 [Bryobacteraceae bacterium]
MATYVPTSSDVSAGPHRDRMYSVWTDYASGEGRMIFTYSTDKDHT